MSLLLAFAMATAAPADTTPGAVVPDCDAHRFEAPVTVTTNGQTKQSKVKICGHVGQTDGQWVETLRDARAKLEANVKMAPSVKEQVVSALDIEIARLAVSRPAEGRSGAVPSAPSPLPPPVALPTSVSLAPPRSAEPVQPVAEYSALPPMPAPLPPAAAVVGAAALPLPAPRLTFRCLATDSLAGEVPCDQLQRGMIVTVRADEDLTGGTSLRFLRRGDKRAEVDLGALRHGQSKRFELPPPVCTGVGGSRVEIQIVRTAGKGSQVVDTRGPFDLSC